MKLAAFALVGLAGCLGPVTPETVGAGVLSLAGANHVVAGACADAAVFVGTAKGADAGRAVLAKCESAHTKSHNALLVFAGAVDAWRGGKGGKPACAALDARVALLDSLDFARSVGADISPRVDDTVAMLAMFVTNAALGECKR